MGAPAPPMRVDAPLTSAPNWTMSIFSPPTLIAASLLLTLGSAPPDLGLPPLVLEWQPFGGSTWTNASGPSEDFFIVRVRGEESSFAGTWVEVTGRVWFSPIFFARMQGSSFDMSQLESFENPPVTWDLAAAGYATPDGVDLPECILEPAHFAALLAKNGSEIPDSELVREFSEPMLGVPVGESETTRRWDLAYEHWNAETRDYWSEINAIDHQPFLFSRDGLIKRLVLDQAPVLDTSFFTTKVWDLALTSGVYFQLQGVTLVGGDIDPGQYPENDEDPPGLVGNWTAKGTTKELPFEFFSYGGQGLTFPSVLPSPYGQEVVSAGDQVVIQMSGLRYNTYARLIVNGDNNYLSVPLSAGETVKDAVFTMPASLERNDVVHVIGFDSPGGWSPLPPGHSFSFIIQD